MRAVEEEFQSAAGHSLFVGIGLRLRARRGGNSGFLQCNPARNIPVVGLQEGLMAFATRQTVVALWHYQCPQCGIGSADTAAFAVSDAIYCEVCLEEGQPVRLRRWPLAEDEYGGATSPPRCRTSGR
jgi:hypothetical protein